MIYVWSKYRTFLAERHYQWWNCVLDVKLLIFFPPSWHSDDGFAADLQESYYLDQSASPWSHSVSIDELLTSHIAKALEEQQ